MNAQELAKIMPVFGMRLGGVDYPATVTASTVKADKGGMRHAIDATYARGQRRAVITFNTTGQIARLTSGLARIGPNKISLPSASGIGEAVYRITFPHTGRTARIMGAFAEAERNGLPLLTSLPQRFNNPALTGIGQHETTLRVAYFVAKIRAGGLGYDFNSPNSEGWEAVGESTVSADSTDAEMLAALDAQESALVTPATAGAATE